MRREASGETLKSSRGARAAEVPDALDDSRYWRAHLVPRRTLPECPHQPECRRPPTRPRPSLTRQLGLWSAVAVLVGSTIGSGIFRSPAGIADKLPGPLPLMSGLDRGRAVRALRRADARRAVGRVSRRRAGCTSSSARRGDGCRPSCSAGPSSSIIRAASLGAISTTFAEYLLRVLGYDPSARAVQRLGALRRGGRHRAHGDVQLRRRVVELARARTSRRSPSTAGCCSSSCSRSRIGLPQTGGHFTPAAPAGSFHDRRVRARARVGALGVRRMGRPDVRRRRGEGPAAQPAARDHHRHARGDRDLPARQPRVPRGAAGRGDPARRGSSPPTSRSGSSARRASSSSPSR